MVLTQILPSPPEGDEISTGVIEDSARPSTRTTQRGLGQRTPLRSYARTQHPPDGLPTSRRNLHNVALHSFHHAERNLTMISGDAVSDLV